MRQIFLFTFLLATISCFAQEKQNCHDRVYLKDGSVFKGKVNTYEIGGDLQMTTWSGMEMRVPAISVKRIVQKCAGENSGGPKPYTFEEKGWYHATRLFLLPGASGMGFGVQHSSGMKLNRMLGVGLGMGVENFTPGEEDVTTYPVFAEIRGYLMPKRIAPFYTLGAGWAFAGKAISDIEGNGGDWEGGWLAQGQLGYRFGNHFITYLGLRFQRKTYHWEQNWGWGPARGTDEILHKRLEVGIGVLL